MHDTLLHSPDYQHLLGSRPEDLCTMDLYSYWDEIQVDLILKPRVGHPYYISAPHWIQSSAGIRALYYLCHTLNAKGFEAYITNHPYGDYAQFHPWTSDELMAPMLTEQRALNHYQEGRTPIVIYSEVVKGDPLHSRVVARWVMNFPGLLGGDAVYDSRELCFGYSKELAIAAGAPEQILHMPTIDTRIFYPLKQDGEREGCCFFASKYRTVHGGTTISITDNCVEVTRQQANSPTPHQVAELLRKSELFFTYENTALATEAVLCGCPAVFIPNPYLESIIGREELGSDGYAWGTDPDEITRAKATVKQGAINYLNTYKPFWAQLDSFITLTQDAARHTRYDDFINISSWPVIPRIPILQMNIPQSTLEPVLNIPPTIERQGIRKHLHRAEKSVRPFSRKLRKFFQFGKPQ